eukprot:Lithocolla_globosa_v1_NODE_1580_length_2470_cov_13.390476.p5 type:complete len:104 gc:universal NODE_1580_length_2470_cov_13.390476:1841-2152(+)
MKAIPSPEGYGWTCKDGQWQVVWGTLPPVSKAVKELTTCGCNSENGCSKASCSCKKSTFALYRTMLLCLHMKNKTKNKQRKLGTIHENEEMVSCSGLLVRGLH